jgi:hypothetical protein
MQVAGALALVGVLLLVVLALRPPTPSATVVSAGGSVLAPPDASPDPTDEVEDTPATAPRPTPDQRPPQPLPAEQREEVAIQVLNGGAPTGAASAVSGELGAARFEPRTPSDAVESVATTTVFFAPGQRRAAVAAADVVGVARDDVRTADPADANWAAFGADLDVLVVLGPALP